MCTCARTHVRACMHPLHHQGKDHGLPAHGRGQRSMRTIKKKQIPMHVTCSDAPACAGRSSVCTRSLGGLHEDLVHHHASSHAAVHVCVCVCVCVCVRARAASSAPPQSLQPPCVTILCLVCVQSTARAQPPRKRPRAGFKSLYAPPSQACDLCRRRAADI